MALPARTAPIRIAVLANLAPRKLGSLEDWLVAFARVAREAGHTVDVFGHDPIHPEVLASLQRHGSAWGTLASLTQRPAATIARIARRYDVVHATLFGLRELPLLLAYAGWPSRVLFFDQTSHVAGEHAPPSALRRRIARATLLRVAGLGAVSGYVHDRLAKQFGRRRPIRTIYHGVDVTRFAPPANESDRATAGDAIHVMAAAFLIKDKGVDHLIRAMSSPALARARLTVVGDGPEIEAIKFLSQRLGIAERTVFLGLRTDLHLLLRDVDVFVHPAVWHEAFGLTIVEAMAAGCPVVASRIGAIPELVVEGETGFVVPAGDSAAIAQALERLAADPSLRARLGTAARRRAVERFDLDRCVHEHLVWCVDAASGRLVSRPSRRSVDGTAPPIAPLALGRGSARTRQ
jgi:glycosyltransferase involved in cell wall biosynthesis